MSAQLAGAVRPSRRDFAVISALSALAALSGARAAADAGGGPRRVAVLYFENGGDPALDKLKLGLAQMLITDLSGVPGLLVVERTRIAEILAELELGQGGKVDSGTAQRVGALLGAERLVLGAYFELFGTLRIDARVVEVETGRVLSSTGVDGAKELFFGLQDQLAAALVPLLAAGVGVVEPAPKQGAGTQNAVRGPATVVASKEPATVPVEGPTPGPRDPLQAALVFGEGLDCVDRKDIVRARELLERALVLDPGLEEARTELRLLAAKG